MTLLSTPSSIVAHRFLIEAMAGEGGMGSVYRARDLLTGQPVALKVLHVASPSAQEAERFAREARLLSTLEHPGIVRYVAHGQTSEGQPFLAMEWLEGIELTRYLKEQPLSTEDSLLILDQVAEALAVAHRRGIVHRDLKPSNLFLRDGEIARVTLLDFGVARDGGPGGGRGHALTRTGALIGTPGYMAPEQARGQAQLTPSADIFSLGCLFFECLTGRQPFIGDHLEAILVKILFEPEPQLRTLRFDLPEGLCDALEQLLDQMLKKDPAVRLPHAMALLEVLHSLHTPSRHSVPRSVRSASRTQKSLTSSEQQLVSVLIARIGEDSSTQTTLNPREAEESSERLLSACEVLSGYGVHGEVLSDGTMVAAVSPVRGETATDQAERAARFALLIHERSPDSVVALSTGRGVINEKLPIGEAINRAVRLAHSRPPLIDGEQVAVVLDKVTAGLLPPRFRTAPLGEDAVALFCEQVGVDETRLLLGKPTPCVGRESELGQLEAMLAACVDESMPRALLVLAPAGVGKSRLRHEFLRRVNARGGDILTLFGPNDHLVSGTPFSALREALLSLCGVQPGDSSELARGKLWRRLGRELGESESARIVVFLGELCGVPFDEAEFGKLREARRQARQMEDSIRRAFLEWLSAECAAHPVMLILEDLQWGDPATINLLDAALRELGDRPFFILGLGRPEVMESFPRIFHDRVQLMPLRPLSRKASELLVRQVLGAQAPEITAKIVERAAGNALYLEELIRQTAEGKGEEPPQAVVAMLQARIGRLDNEARRTLRAASVFGETCWSGGVAELLGLARAECKRWMVYLVREELLEQRNDSRFPDETEYRFRHGLMREAAYSLFSEADRRLGHFLAGEFLEKMRERPQVLAYHFAEAGEYDKAFHYLLAAGEDAARLGLVREERRHYAAAHEQLLHLPNTASLRRRHLELLLRQVGTGFTHDAADVQVKRLAEARALLHSFGDSEGDAALADARLRIEALSGWVSYYAGRSSDALRCFQKVQPLAEEKDDRTMALQAALGIACIMCLTGRFSSARERLEWLLEPLSQLPDRIEWLRGQACYISALSAMGRGKEAREETDRALCAVRTANHAPTQARMHIMLGASHALRANFSAVLREGEALLALAEVVGDSLYYYGAWDLISWAQSHLGLHEEALMLRIKAREQRKIFGGVLRDWMNASDCEMLLLAGQPEAALSQAQAVLKEVRPAEQLLAINITERVAGTALLELGADLPDIEARFRSAFSAAKEGQYVVGQALTEVAWADALIARGDRTGEAKRNAAIKALFAAGCDEAAQTFKRRG